MERSGSLLVSLLVLISAWRSFPQPSLAAADPNVWRQQVIYLVMTDRFENGDHTNDPLGITECFCPPTAPPNSTGGIGRG